MNKGSCLLVAFLLCILVVLGAGVMMINPSFARGLTVDGLASTHRGSTPTVSSSAPDMRVVGKPTVSAAFINRVLAYYHSPAAGKGQTLYTLGVAYSIDPVIALAFFMHESRFGTLGMATTTLSLGNLRCIPSVPCYQGYAQFGSWEQGFEAWYKLIHTLYVVQWGLVTVDQIIPRYAPSKDHNNVEGYIAAVTSAIQTWRSGQVQVVHL